MTWRALTVPIFTLLAAVALAGCEGASEATPTSTDAGLPEGPYDLWSQAGAPPMKVTIPAPGWFGEPGQGVVVKNDTAEPPAGAGMIVWTGMDKMYAYGDPCAWSTTIPDTPATTVDEAVAALGNQASRDASEPVDITVDGHDGKAITLHVPEDADFGTCDWAMFGMFSDKTGTEPDFVARYAQGPGQIDEVWVLDVDGKLAVIDWAYYEGTPQADVDELRAIAESATFEMQPRLFDISKFRAAYKEAYGTPPSPMHWYRLITGMKMTGEWLDITTKLDAGSSDRPARAICGAASKLALDSGVLGNGIEGVRVMGSDGMELGGCG